MNRFKKITSGVSYLIKSNKKPLSVYIIIGVVLLLCGYIMNNQTLFTQEHIIEYAFSDFVSNTLGIKGKDYSDSVFYVDVSGSKSLYKYKRNEVEYNDFLTDRKQLANFLSICSKDSSYKYIILDLRFEKQSNFSDDSILFAIINRVPRILVAMNDTNDLSFKNINRDKIMRAEYQVVNNFTSFYRYPIYSSDIKNIYTKAYEDINQRKISRFGPLYFDNLRLCHNSIFIKFVDTDNNIDKEIHLNIDDAEEIGIVEQNEKYNALSELLRDDPEQTIPAFIKGRYVIIGNMVDDDSHDTYAGTKQGPELVFNALITLNNKKHFVSFCFTLFLFLVYTTIAFLIFKRKTIFDYIPPIKNSRSRTIRFVCSLLEFSSVFFVIELAYFMMSGIAYSFVLQIFLLSIVKLIIDFKRIIL